MSIMSQTELVDILGAYLEVETPGFAPLLPVIVAANQTFNQSFRTGQDNESFRTRMEKLVENETMSKYALPMATVSLMCFNHVIASHSLPEMTPITSFKQIKLNEVVRVDHLAEGNMVKTLLSNAHLPDVPIPIEESDTEGSDGILNADRFHESLIPMLGKLITSLPRNAAMASIKAKLRKKGRNPDKISSGKRESKSVRQQSDNDSNRRISMGS